MFTLKNTNMEKIKTDTKIYARIKGVGVVPIADEKMTLNEAINAKSYQGGLPTKYLKQHVLGDTTIYTPEHCRCFISLCDVKRKEFKESPNFKYNGYIQPDCFR